MKSFLIKLKWLSFSATYEIDSVVNSRSEILSLIPDWDSLLPREKNVRNIRNIDHSPQSKASQGTATYLLGRILEDIDSRVQRKGTCSINLLKKACVLMAKLLTRPKDLRNNFHIWKRRPIDYPSDAPYGDPNNKDKITEYRMSKDDLKVMFDFYRQKYDSGTYLIYPRWFEMITN